MESRSGGHVYCPDPPLFKVVPEVVQVISLNYFRIQQEFVYCIEVCNWFELDRILDLCGA